MGTTTTRSVIRFYKPAATHKISYCTTAKINKYSTIVLNGNLTYWSLFHKNKPKTDEFKIISINHHFSINSIAGVYGSVFHSAIKESSHFI